jgi:hypothetical protein
MATDIDLSVMAPAREILVPGRLHSHVDSVACNSTTGLPRTI